MNGCPHIVRNAFRLDIVVKIECKRQEWVPKKKPLPDTPRQETQPQLQNLTPDNVIVPINSDEEEGWQPINRKQESKLPGNQKGKKSTEQLFSLAESEQEGDPAGMVEDPGPHHQ
jgi:hypothetical protein